eukprot:1180332-Ditylum_brightwellii.AAC.1
MNELDDAITRIMEEAEATLPEVLHHWWSDTLHHEYKVTEFWKAYMSFQQNGMEDNYVLWERMNAINPAIDTHQGDVTRKPKGQLRKPAKYLKKCRNDIRKLRDEYLQRIALEDATTNGNIDVAKI